MASGCADPGLARRLTAEALGTGFLLMAVVGSGIMGERLAAGNAAIALLANTLATGAALVVLVAIFAPVSGAHFNPCVSLYRALRREMGMGTALLYAGVQMVSAVLGVWLSHAMFARTVLEVSHKLRDGPAQGLSEFIATFGLFGAIAGGARLGRDAAAMLVGLYIAAAYWFTASTAFANPAVTLARMLTDSFAGIAPQSAAAFLAAQVAASLAALLVWPWLLADRTSGPECEISGKHDQCERDDMVPAQRLAQPGH